ncbi:flagellin, partial [Aminobacterium sp. UBA5277]
GIQDLVNTINSRFQGQDIRAGIVKDGGEERLVFWSPKGYSFKVEQNGDDSSALLGTPAMETSSRGGSGPYSQRVAVRTGADREASDFFGVLDNLARAVRQGDQEGVSSALMGKIDSFQDNLLRIRTREGAVQKRYTSNNARLKQNNLNLTDLYSKVSDVDLAEAYTQYKMNEAVYQASLAIIARIVQPTLVDFLR